MKQAADLYAEKEKHLYIQTVKGRRFYMDAPSFDIEEIAHATAMQCRYTGHTREFYSVAEHCVIVSRLVEDLAVCRPGTPFEGLMHDAHEAYVSDIASPWKVLIPDYQKMEKGLESKLRVAYQLPEKISEGVKLADWLALFVEAGSLLLPGVTDDWITPSEDFRTILAPVIAGGVYRPVPLAPGEARKAFLDRYAELGGM